MEKLNLRENFMVEVNTDRFFLRADVLKHINENKIEFYGSVQCPDDESVSFRVERTNGEYRKNFQGSETYMSEAEYIVMETFVEIENSYK